MTEEQFMKTPVVHIIKMWNLMLNENKKTETKEQVDVLEKFLGRK